MSEAESKLAKALAGNGTLDAEQARRLGADTAAWFDRCLKRTARGSWLTVMLGATLIEVALIGFVFSFNTKLLIGLAVLFVIVGIRGIGYTITNTKISLLKEIKLLRLERLGMPNDEVALLARKSAMASASEWSSLSPRENVAWALMALLVAAVSASAALWLWWPGGRLIDECRVTLSPDGAGSSLCKTSYPYLGWSPLTSTSMWTGLGPCTITRWLDAQGRELLMKVEVVGRNRRYTVELVEPVMPGEQVRQALTIESPKMATEEKGLWTYRGDPVYGYRKNVYLATIQLPKGAEIVAVEPQPAQRFVRDGVPTVRFQAVRQRNQKFHHMVQYRLPAGNAPQRVTK